MNSKSDLPRRRAMRLRGYDYSQPGAYFVTTIGVNLGVFRSLFEFAKGCVFSSAFLESASIFK